MSDLSRMWFRLTGSGGSTTTEECDDHSRTNSPTTTTINLMLNHDSNNNNNSDITSKFDKFRRGSFRKKSTSLGQQRPQGPKRTKSPHITIKSQQSTSLEEADEMEEKEISPLNQHLKNINDKSPNIALNSKQSQKQVKIKEKKPKKKAKEKDTEKEEVYNIIPHSDSLTKCNNSKKCSMKSIKNNQEPQKKKFYKNFYTSKASSQESEGVGVGDEKKPIDKDQLHTIFPPNTSFVHVSALAEDDDEDIDDEDNEEDDDDSDDTDSETDDTADSNEEKDTEDTNSPSPTTPDNLPRSGKEKIFLTDRKFRNNRIEKSSSKSKIAGDLEKRESIKRSRSNRKIPTASALLAVAEEKQKQKQQAAQQQKKLKTDSKDTKKPNRPHSNLNLHALVKFVMNNKKFLNTDDFNLIRRKSISEAASAVIQVAATCKPMPIALKYPQDGFVADAPKVNDPKAERNVVLVKKQSLSNAFGDRLLNNNTDSLKPPVKERKKSPKSSVSSISSITNNKVKRNSSNSSKSSGNYEDEAFYSCDEREEEDELDCAPLTTTTIQRSHGEIITSTEPKRKSSSPSLTSRVAAKINETTNNYKNRKAANKNAKKRKNLAASAVAGVVERNEGPEFYKQLNVERLNSTSIQRHPSDRRTDSANLSIRSNGNSSSAHLNVSDLQSSFHGNDTSLGAVGSSAQAGLSANVIGNNLTTSCSDTINPTLGALSAVSQQNIGAVSPGGSGALAGTLNDINAQDANEGNLRRERLHQQHQQNKSAPVSVNRSESYKERLSHKRNRSQRKTSDPNLTSRPNDDQHDLGLSNSNFTASSNSSLSSGGGSESPSTSMEQMGGAGVATPTTASSVHHPQHHHHHQHSHQDSFHGSIGGSSNASFLGGTTPSAGGQMARHWNFESDEEDDLNEADWSSNVSGEILAALTDADKKRQEIINEIYQTERSHVRTLKLLKHLFFFPLQESNLLTQEHLMLLFPSSLGSLCDLHGAFEQKLKQRRLDHNYIVNSVGDLLAGMFDGKSGEDLREYAAQFCARQQIALEALKEKRRKDEQLQKLLSKAESHKACRRLQLKDLLPTVLQRLTKYPLLFENLYKVTVRVVPEDTAEAEAIQKALESSKKILVDVNQAVKTAEDAHKLQNIQRKLDKSTFDKDEFKNLDLTQHRLIHDGSLTMKKNPSIQLHGLLFETMIVLLTKQDDKYSLKYLHAARNTEVNNKPVSPIMNIDSETLVRQEAADKNSFFLIKTKTSQMLELRAPSSSECKTWFKHISDAAEQYKPRSKNANQEPVDDPAIATLPHSNTRESLELTPERPPPQSATATLITTPLAPMMPVPAATQDRSGFAHSNNNDVQMRNGRRESTPTSTASVPSSDSYPPYYNIKQRLSHNELSPNANANAVNRTMSTRSCGDANHNYSNTSPEFAGANGVTLRHTQSARQANGSAEDGGSNASTVAGAGNKRDSASIVYSNNSNNTRTLMQSSPPLVEPTAIQISISPAHTAEPVLTPAEKLRRLDASIRDGLMEKQKIICDMFRLPVEHFHEIVDIAAMPEAPKDSTDIALAAYAQVQSLTEVINDYMKVTPEQEVSAVSTAVCDKCHEKRACGKVMEAKSALTTTSSADTPPPLPPPNKQMAQAQQQTPAPSVTKMQTCTLEDNNIHEDDDGYCEIDELRLPALPPLTKTQTPLVDSHVATPPPLPPAVKVNASKQGSPPPPLPPPAGSFKTPPPPPPPPAKTIANQNSASSSNASTTTAAPTSTPELVKRQSTISADSIPEESADEVTNALNDHIVDKMDTRTTTELKETEEEHETEKEEPPSATKEHTEKTKTVDSETTIENSKAIETLKQETIAAPIATIEDENDDEDKDEDSAMHTAECESAPLDEDDKEKEVGKQPQDDDKEQNDKDTNNKTIENDVKDLKDDVMDNPISTTSMTAEPQRQNSNATQADEISLNSEHIEINEAYECLSNINKLNTALTSLVDNSTQTLPLTTPLPVSTSTTMAVNIATSNSSSVSGSISGHIATLCGPNRIQHANSLEPSVPCHALSSIVSALNNQISLLLPKISERDMERERLRKENQHLRELLNAMHDRQRVEAKLETPSDITTCAEVADDEIDGFSPATSTTPTPTPTPTAANSAAALGEDQTKENNTATTSNNTTTPATTAAAPTRTSTTNTVEAQN